MKASLGRGLFVVFFLVFWGACGSVHFGNRRYDPGATDPSGTAGHYRKTGLDARGKDAIIDLREGQESRPS